MSIFHGKIASSTCFPMIFPWKSQFFGFSTSTAPNFQRPQAAATPPWRGSWWRPPSWWRRRRRGAASKWPRASWGRCWETAPWAQGESLGRADFFLSGGFHGDFWWLKNCLTLVNFMGWWWDDTGSNHAIFGLKSHWWWFWGRLMNCFNHIPSIGWLVVSDMAFIFRNIWDNPSHWLIFFSEG